MKKLILFLAAGLLSCLEGFAADLTTVWEEIMNENGFIIADVPDTKANQNGFETLKVALNSAPSTADINKAKQLVATIDAGQKVTSVSQNGVNVSIYAAPASADASLYKLFVLIDMNENADNKALIVLYGTCSRENMANALNNMSIESIIGG